ncbi:MAG TPA: thioesterase family protein [Solirubrobacterales bacterium]|jgi:acyl-CoA thioester hydrolase|nr:thioesterase family protein [Solirubrobacterales bacterium]
MSAGFVHRFRVRYGECDPQGIVFNANYVAYFDLALTELWREAFGSYQSMVDRGIDMVVAHLELDFRASARFDDLVSMTARIERLGTTSMTTRLELHRDEELLIEGRIRHVFIDPKSWEKTEMPSWVKEGLEAFLDV